MRDFLGVSPANLNRTRDSIRESYVAYGRSIDARSAVVRLVALRAIVMAARGERVAIENGRKMLQAEHRGWGRGREGDRPVGKAE